MNLLPKNSLWSRLVALVVAVGALALVSVAPASAADPAWTAGQVASVRAANINWTIVDSETFGYDYDSFYIPNTNWGALGWNWKSFDNKISRCGGGEVRVELEVIGTTNAFQILNVKARLKLYEGTSCSSTDLDGVSPWRYIAIRPGENVDMSLSVENTDEGGDRSALGMNFRASAAGI